MTPFEMTTSKLSSSNGRSSIRRLEELDVREVVGLGQARAARELRVGEVDADDAAGLADGDRGAERVRAGAGAEVEHTVAGLERGQVVVVADACEGVDGRLGDEVEELSRDSRAESRARGPSRSAAAPAGRVATLR